MPRALDSLSPIVLLLTLSTACLDVENDLAVDGDGDGETEFEGDCDDSDPVLNSQTLWAMDLDADGYGDPDEVQYSCESPGDNWVMEDTSDCDDSQSETWPGAAELKPLTFLGLKTSGRRPCYHSINYAS